jgi:asparagine synthase (glutamine-hydrolysing)
MSAIAGVFGRNGRLRDPGEVDRMLAVMASRGPDGSRTWTNETITLGHGALHATPESLNEVMPFVDRATGNVIVADVRLDNRDELIDALRPSGPTDRLGDGRLLLEAYREWGEDCVAHLLGDFAFGIWDDRRRQLFLARDHFGAKPLTYHVREHLFAFASDSRSIIGLDDVPVTIDRDRVFDFLVDATEWIDTTSTFFAGVKRLPPAHTLTVTASDQRVRRYWHLPEPEILRLSSDAEYEEATREVLGLAVQCRLRGREDVGVVLSGGIDSSSIAATARARGRVRSYSAVSDHDDTTETAFIRSTVAQLDLDASYVDPSSVHDLCGDFSTAQRAAESLFDNGAMVQAVFGIAANDGSRSVVSGIFADEVVAIPASLAMRTFLADRRSSQCVRLIASRGNLASSRLGLSRSAMSLLMNRSARVEHLLKGRRARHRDDWLWRALGGQILRTTVDERTHLVASLDAMAAQWSPGDTPWSPRHRLLDGGYSAAGLERYDRSAATCSLESRAPFTDRRLVEFFLSLPAEQLVSGGWSKAILRRSMVGRLPAAVVWNREKPHLGPQFTKVWVDCDPTEFFRDLPVDHPIDEFVDRVTLLKKDDGDTDDTQDWRVRCMSLSLWLEALATR